MVTVIELVIHQHGLDLLQRNDNLKSSSIIRNFLCVDSLEFLIFFQFD